MLQFAVGVFKIGAVLTLGGERGIPSLGRSLLVALANTFSDNARGSSILSTFIEEVW